MRTLVLLCLPLVVACSKDTSPGPVLDDHLQWCVDSCIVQAPNVFTANGDGIDDVWFVLAKNATSLSVEIRNDDNDIVYTATGANNAWNGRANNSSSSPLIPGRYQYTLELTSTSGQTLMATHDIHLVTDIFGQCFNARRDPVFGDQLDPRVCGVTYATNDHICQYP